MSHGSFQVRLEPSLTTPSKIVMNKSPPSSPSESSLLAFSYENVYDELNYPNDYHNSQSPSLDPPGSHTPNVATRDGATPLLSRSIISPKELQEHLEDEYVVDTSRNKIKMDPFSPTEIAVMVLSSILVGILIIIAIMMTLGELSL